MLNSVYSKLNKEYDLKTIGINTNSDYMASDIITSTQGCNFKIKYLDNSINVKLNIGTLAFVYNSLMAFAIGKYLNIDDEKIKYGIENVKLTNSRLDIKQNNRGVTVIDDTYNASYDSMKYAIEFLGKNSNRKIAVLGDMLELGDYSLKIHRKVGKEIVDNKIDILITVGEYSKEIATEAIKNGFNKNNIYSFEKQEDTYDLLNKLLQEDDIILLKGSNGIKLKKVVEEIMKFN